MKEVKAAQCIQDVVNYCTEHIGKLRYLGTDGVYKFVETRIFNGGFAKEGTSSLDELSFTKANLSDQSMGTIPGQVVVHETVHQWWGLSNMFAYEPTGLWSHEGITEYTSYRIAKALYGEEYAENSYIKRWKDKVSSYYNDFYVRHPEYLDRLPKLYQGEIASSLGYVRQYYEMPLKLLKAEQLVGGEEKMDAILSQLHNREINDDNYILTYEMFLDACGLSEEDLELE